MKSWKLGNGVCLQSKMKRPIHRLSEGDWKGDRGGWKGKQAGIYLWMCERTQGWQRMLGHHQTNFAPQIYLWPPLPCRLTWVDFTQSFRPSGFRRSSHWGMLQRLEGRRRVRSGYLFIAPGTCLQGHLRPALSLVTCMWISFLIWHLLPPLSLGVS